ncbi:MAG: aldehyde dehydrogenase family protein, partial [Tabrizicola sp.]|nr:aldehyde dehydrogenase family protein [Tabrizicola sp.]
GNAPALVFEGADLDVAVRGLIDAKFRNAGQTCVCANRIYVQAPIYDAFAVRLAKAVAGLTVGDGRDEGTRIGPLIDGAARRRICGLIDSAVSGGARIMTGGGAAPVPGGQFLAPTVLSGVSHDMEIARTEIFGPVAPLIRFDTESEAIALANDSIHGLAAYVFDRDPDRLVRVT